MMMDGPNRQAKVPLLCRSTGENEGESIISGNGTSVASHHKRINIARPQQATQLWLSLDENEFDTLTDEIETDMVRTRVSQISPNIRFHVDSNVWDVIHKEVMDWRDSSWTHMAVPENQTCMSLSLLIRGC